MKTKSLIKKLKKLFFRLTGGRPMEDIGLSFPDPITGKKIRVYRDKHNQLTWASYHPWKSKRRQVELHFNQRLHFDGAKGETCQKQISYH